MTGNALIKRHDASLASTRSSLMIEEMAKKETGLDAKELVLGGVEGFGIGKSLEQKSWRRTFR